MAPTSVQKYVSDALLALLKGAGSDEIIPADEPLSLEAAFPGTDALLIALDSAPCGLLW